MVCLIVSAYKLLGRRSHFISFPDPDTDETFIVPSIRTCVIKERLLNIKSTTTQFGKQYLKQETYSPCIYNSYDTYNNSLAKKRN